MGYKSSLEMLEEERAERIVLESLKGLMERAEKGGHKDCYFTTTEIAGESNSQIDYDERKSLRTPRIFRSRNTQGLLESKLSGLVESVIYLGPNGYRPLYRIKKQ